MRSRFLSTRQGKNTLTDYAQDLRALMASMHTDPPPDTDCGNVFVEKLCAGVASTEAFRVHPSSFEEAVSIAQNA